MSDNAPHIVQVECVVDDGGEGVHVQVSPVDSDDQGDVIPEKCTVIDLESIETTRSNSMVTNTDEVAIITDVDVESTAEGVPASKHETHETLGDDHPLVSSNKSFESKAPLDAEKTCPLNGDRVAEEYSDYDVVFAIEKVMELKTGRRSRRNKKAVDLLNGDAATHMTKKRVKVTQQLIDAAYNRLLTITHKHKLTTENVAMVSAYAVQLADKLLKTAKKHKAELTMAILRQYIIDYVDLHDRHMMNTLVENVVPTLISAISGIDIMSVR
jgi:ribosomal protein L31E